MIFRAMQMAVGERRTIELSLTGREFLAPEAQAFGLVTEIAITPVKRALELGAQIADYSASAVSAGLDYARQIRGCDWETAGLTGRKVREGLLTSPEYRASVQAFLHKP